MVVLGALCRRPGLLGLFHLESTFFGLRRLNKCSSLSLLALVVRSKESQERDEARSLKSLKPVISA